MQLSITTITLLLKSCSPFVSIGPLFFCRATTPRCQSYFAEISCTISLPVAPPAREDFQSSLGEGGLAFRRLVARLAFPAVCRMKRHPVPYPERLDCPCRRPGCLGCRRWCRRLRSLPFTEGSQMRRRDEPGQ